jgi:hypothetical protein
VTTQYGRGATTSAGGAAGGGTATAGSFLQGGNGAVTTEYVGGGGGGGYYGGGGGGSNNAFSGYGSGPQGGGGSSYANPSAWTGVTWVGDLAATGGVAQSLYVIQQGGLLEFTYSASATPTGWSLGLVKMLG